LWKNTGESEAAAGQFRQGRGIVAGAGKIVAGSKVVSLKRVRKARARAESQAQADANAVKFGRTRAQRALEEARLAQDRKALDQHRRDEE
jgi:hypothetical protein